MISDTALTFDTDPRAFDTDPRASGVHVDTQTKTITLGPRAYVIGPVRLSTGWTVRGANTPG